MTFEEAYAEFGPDVECIARATGIKPAAADRLINKEMNRAYAERQAKAARRVSYAGFDLLQKAWAGS